MEGEELAKENVFTRVVRGSERKKQFLHLVAMTCPLFLMVHQGSS